MSSLTNSTTNRISSSFNQPTFSTSDDTATLPNTGDNVTPAGLTTMGLAAGTGTSNAECDAKRSISAKLDEHYANFYALNRSLPVPPPPPLAIGASNDAFSFMPNATG